jgi:hypothetical protein
LGFEIVLNSSALAGISGSAKKALYNTAEAMRTDVINAQVMPYDNGDMQNNQTFCPPVEDTGEGYACALITGSPQARRLYYHPEYNFQTVNNPNAGAGWLEPWIDGDRKDFAAQTFASFLKEAIP